MSTRKEGSANSRPFPYPGCPDCGWQYPSTTIAAWNAGELSLVDTNPTHLCGVDLCPACGDTIDHCQGHGFIGDPDKARVLVAHYDRDEHDGCHHRGCPIAAAALAESMRQHPAGRGARR